MVVDIRSVSKSHRTSSLGRVNKPRYRLCLSGTSTWVQSTIFECPRSFQSEPNSKIRPWICSNSLAIGRYAELFGTIAGCMRLPKSVDREWCNTSWISRNLQFSGNFEGFVHISTVSDKLWDSLGTPEHLFALRDAESCVSSAKSFQMLQNHWFAHRVLNTIEWVHLSKERWSVVQKGDSSSDSLSAVPVLHNSAHTDQCYR